MKKRWSAFLLAIVLLFSLSSTAFACDEKQTNTYITQILFGDRAQSKSSDENVRMLLAALYLCSEQADNLGQDKIDFLKQHKVSGVPNLTSLNIKGTQLLECSHNAWESEYARASKNQASRRTVLRNTVNKVFDFGFFNNLFGSSSGKCDSFAALLYYSHILSDYLADDPSETEIAINGRLTSAYSGQASTTVNGNQPSFTASEKELTESFVHNSPLDNQGRAGVAFGCIGPDTLSSVGDRENMVGIRPSGWSNFNRYDGIVNSQPAYLYNRCHLIAHQLGGKEEEVNLVTGTRYLNETGMIPYEDEVARYIKSTGNHVLYRVTPIFKGDNKLVSGVQLEAYSVEDNGQGVCFNVFCYNVQPGVDLNYVTGDNEISDITFGAENILSFPDLIREMKKHLEILFEGQKNTGTYTSMMSRILSIESEVRNVDDGKRNAAQIYIAMKQYQYEYFDVLKTYVPLLLAKENFFKSAFK